MTPRALRWALGGLLVAAAFVLGIVKIQDTDAWTHLALGREIVRAGGFPRHEPFVFPSLALPYYNPEWLFDLVFYLAHLAAGLAGVILLKASIVALAFGILLKDALVPPDPPSRRPLGAAVAVAVVVPFLAIVRHRFVERPDIALMGFLVFTIYALNAYLHEGRRYLYLLPLLQVLWANMHPSILVGVVPFVAVLAGGGVQHLLETRRSVRLPGTPSARQLAVVAAVFAAVLLASLLNPYGAEPFVAPFRLAAAPWLRHEVTELQAPRWHEYAPPFVIVALLVVAFVVSVRRLPLVSLLMVAPFAYLGLSAKRFAFLLAVVSAPILARQLRLLVAHLPESWTVRLTRPAALIAAVSVVAVTGLTLGRVEPFVEPQQVPGIGINHDRLPESALRYLDRVGLNGRVFNTFHWGGYIAWRDFPRRAPFVDGRGYLPPGLLDEMMAARATPARLERLRAQYGFDVAVLEYPRGWSPASGETPEVDLGLASPDWALVYWDDVALVYVRRTEGLAGLIERDAYRHVKPANGVLALRQQLGERTRLAAAERELRRNIAETGSSIGRTLLGFVYNEVGSHERAIELLSPVADSAMSPGLGKTVYSGLAFAHDRLGHPEQAIGYWKKAARFGDDAPILYNLGMTYAKLGDDREAVRYLARALELDRRLTSAYPVLIAAYRRLGRAEQAQKLEAGYAGALAYAEADARFWKGLKAYLEGRYQDAIGEFRASLALYPQSAMTRSNLGWVYFDLGLFDKAFAEQTAALAIDPNFANAHYGLALVHRHRGERAQARAHFEKYLRLEPTGYWARQASEELNRLAKP